MQHENSENPRINAGVCSHRGNEKENIHRIITLLYYIYVFFWQRLHKFSSEVMFEYPSKKLLQIVEKTIQSRI